MKPVAASVVVLALAACQEIPQDARKPYAGPEETKAYLGETFKSDKEQYEKSLARRARTQDEYARFRPK